MKKLFSFLDINLWVVGCVMTQGSIRCVRVFFRVGSAFVYKRDLINHDGWCEDAVFVRKVTLFY